MFIVHLRGGWALLANQRLRARPRLFALVAAVCAVTHATGSEFNANAASGARTRAAPRSRWTRRERASHATAPAAGRRTDWRWTDSKAHSAPVASNRRCA